MVAFHVTKLTPSEFEEVEIELGVGRPGSTLGGSRAPKPSWNSERQHHIDVQQLPSGEWVAALDGDRVPSSE